MGVLLVYLRFQPLEFKSGFIENYVLNWRELNLITNGIDSTLKSVKKKGY